MAANPCDELVGQPPDEADRVGDEVTSAVVLERSVVGSSVSNRRSSTRDGRVRERVQERGLARVRVAGERDQGRVGPLAGDALGVTLALERARPLAQERDAAPGEPSVGLELRLAGAARADAAAETLQVLPHPAHAREVVLELRELDLELALGGACMLREDVEDELGAIDDADPESVLEAALEARVDLVVDDQGLGAGLGDQCPQLLELALADVCARVGPWAALHDLADDLHPRCAQELAGLGQLFLLVGLGRDHRDEEAPLGLRARGGVGLVLRHTLIMPAPWPDLARESRLELTV